jgi:hypothetical protein
VIAERSRSTAAPEVLGQADQQFGSLLRIDGTQIPDEATVVVGGRTREKPRWSWKRRLMTSALGGLLTAAAVLVGLVWLAPKDQGADVASEPTPSFIAPTISGLRATDRSPTSITIAWHTQGAFAYPHQVRIEGREPIWLEEAQVKAETAVLTDLKPKKRYCMTVDVLYRGPEATETEQPYSNSSSERKCFSTRK